MRPIYLHAADRQWVMRPDPRIQFLGGRAPSRCRGMTLIRCGGHFAGGTVLHWPDGAEGRGALLSGDIITVVPDRRYVSFMYSYPNLIPLPAWQVRRIVAAVEPYPFDRIYGAWWDRVVPQDGKAAVAPFGRALHRRAGAGQRSINPSSHPLRSAKMVLWLLLSPTWLLDLNGSLREPKKRLMRVLKTLCVFKTRINPFTGGRSPRFTEKAPAAEQLQFILVCRPGSPAGR